MTQSLSPTIGAHISVIPKVLVLNGKACSGVKKKRKKRLNLEGWRREEEGTKRACRAGKVVSGSSKCAIS